MSHSYLHQDSVEMLVSMALCEKQKVRHSISQKCSNSFVKAKKKLTVEKDYDRYSSMKSLYHSIRMSVFAYHYAKDGIIKPSVCSNLYKEITEDYENHSDEEVLELINTKYKGIYNEKMRLFRLFYPKWENYGRSESILIRSTLWLVQKLFNYRRTFMTGPKLI